MDDLTRIKGIGKSTAKKLAAAGIDSFEKLAVVPAGEHGVEASWIAAAAELLNDGANDADPEEANTTAETPDGRTQSGSPNTSGDRAGDGMDAPPADHPDRIEFPRLYAALDAWKAAHPDEWPDGVRIRAKRDGFRRAGAAHSKAPVVHPAGTFDMRQMEQLLSDPMLTVELVAGDNAA